MKKKNLLCALALTALMATGCSTQQNQLENIGLEAAKAAALEAAGLAASEVEFSAANLNDRNGVAYYAVDFTADGEQYTYDVDALTGVIIHSQGPRTDGVPQQAAESALQDSPSPGAGSYTVDGEPVPQIPAGGEAPYQYKEPVHSAPTAQTLPVVTQNPAERTMLSEEEAKAAALAHAGLDAGQVTFIKSGLDWDDGVQTYDLEFYTQDHREYDYDIDPYTGEVLQFDFDAEYYTPPAPSGSGGGEARSITAEEAKQIALAQVPGTAAGDIREFETDYDDGRLEYEGKIYYDHMEYEFEIDGYSGAIRSWEVESIYD